MIAWLALLICAWISRHCDVRYAEAAVVSCLGALYENTSGAVCTPQGPYCPAYPLDGQQGTFYWALFVSNGQSVFPSSTINVATSTLVCAQYSSRIVTREEIGFSTFTKVDYAVDPQYTGVFTTERSDIFAWERRNYQTFLLTDATGKYSTEFWRRTSAIRFLSLVTLSSMSAGQRFSAWITHLDINYGSTWSYFDMQLTSRTGCTNTPYTAAGQTITSCFISLAVSLPLAYARGPVNNPYIDIPYGDAALFTHDGNKPVPIIPPATICQVNCGKLGPNFQCNIAGSKCECIPPLLPIFSADGVTISGECTTCDL